MDARRRGTRALGTRPRSILPHALCSLQPRRRWRVRACGGGGRGP
jgi:hypothetical protein